MLTSTSGKVLGASPVHQGENSVEKIFMSNYPSFHGGNFYNFQRKFKVKNNLVRNPSRTPRQSYSVKSQ